MNILQINSSARRDGSHSTRLADTLVARLRAADPDATLDRARPGRDAASGARRGRAAARCSRPPTQRTPEQAARVALDDALIAEIQAADVVVLGVPMYNFGVPAQLKNWIDAISRASVTFRYTANGPEGLLKGKKVYVALTRGGKYRNTPADTQVPYLKTVLALPRHDRRALRVRRRPGDGRRTPSSDGAGRGARADRRSRCSMIAADADSDRRLTHRPTRSMQ